MHVLRKMLSPAFVGAGLYPPEMEPAGGEGTEEGGLTSPCSEEVMPNTSLRRFRALAGAEHRRALLRVHPHPAPARGFVPPWVSCGCHKWSQCPGWGAGGDGVGSLGLR